MPRGKRVCFCNVCKGKLQPIDSRKVHTHTQLYGTFQHRDTTDFLERNMGIPEFECLCEESVIHDALDDPSSESDSCDEVKNSGTFKRKIISNLEDETSKWPRLSDEESTLDYSASGHSSSSEDDTLTDSDTSSSEDLDSEHQTEWSCSFDQSVYSSDVAVSKVPNSDVTVLQWLAMNFSLFTSHPAISKSTFSDCLQVQNILKTSDVHVNEIKLPTTYKEARSMIEPYLVQKKVFKFCVNNCIAFRNDSSNLKECPKCHSVEQKRFVYLPVGPRIARIFGEESLAKILQCHDGSTYTRSLMWDIHDAPIWKDIYSEEGYFQGNRNGISFALELDGVNPYHNIGIQYSMTPIMLTLLNLPRNIRNQFGNIFLVGIIPGSGCSEVSNVNPYIEILVDELLYLTKCKITDAYLKAPVDIKIKVLLFVLDYPGLCKVFSQQGSGGLSGCHWCHIRGVYCSHLSKTIYLSNSTNSANFSSSSTASKNGTKAITEGCSQPKLRDSNSETYFREAYTNVRTKVDANIISTATGCKGKYALQLLPGHNRLEETLPDACHTVKDVVQNIMYLVTNRNINMQKLLKAEQEYNRIDPVTIEADSAERKYMSSAACTYKKGKKKVNKSDTGKADESTLKLSCSVALPYILTENEIKVADKRGSSIRVPLGFGIKPGPFISKPGSLKSHDWKQIACQGILKFCLREMLSKECRKTLFSLLDRLTVLCAESHYLDDLDVLEDQLNKDLLALERCFPLALQNITTHLLKHIVPGIRKYGPVYGTWMYVFERFNSWICKRSLNMRYPEATVLETFVIYDWCQFMFASGRMPVGYRMSDPEADENETALGIDRDHSVDGEMKTLGRELRSVHRLCTTCERKKCKVKRQLSYQIIRPDSGRLIRYSCSNKVNAQTVSSYVSFERKRTNPGIKLSSGKYVVFGRVLYFLNHVGEDSKQSVIACIEAYNNAYFDNDCGLWYCNLSDLMKKKFYVEVSDLSNPLVTAVENELIWFLNSGKLPVEDLLEEAEH